MQFNTVEEVNKFFEKMDAIIPGFSEAIQKKYDEEKKEQENKQMLQEKQNLHDTLVALNAAKKLKQTEVDGIAAEAQPIRDKITELELEIEELEQKLEPIDNKFADADSDLAKIDEDIGKVEKQLEDIYKKWIAANPAKNTTKRVSIKEVFDIFWKHYSIPHDDYKVLYKRFDNIINARCKRSRIFGEIWTIERVYEELAKYGFKDLVESVKIVNETMRGGWRS